MLWSLEAYGFCGRGEAGDFSSASNLEWPGGSLPVNTSGGGLSEVYIHGFNLVTEGVRQIRGTSTNQVEDTRAVPGGERRGRSHERVVAERHSAVTSGGGRP